MSTRTLPSAGGITDPPQSSERSSHHIIYKSEYIIFSHSSETAHSPDTYPLPTADAQAQRPLRLLDTLLEPLRLKV